MLQANQNYVHGTAAEKIQYDVYEENKVLRSKKVARSNSKQKLKLVGFILVAFAMCFILMLRYAQITEVNYTINKTNVFYNKLKDENVALKVSINQNMDLNKVRETAETKLGMHKPDKYQIVYITVPKNDFTKLEGGNEASGKSGSGALASITSKISKFTQLLY